MTYYDLLVFLFPYYLNEAMRKGIYKEYVKREYNNANIKGAVDVAKHIRSNVPFVGKVAYRTREFSYNNHLTQLIRHTIEKIQNEYDFLLSG
ncbi:guanosine 5'-monophosphate oxidoreductase, partial [Enterococcus sp. C84]